MGHQKSTPERVKTAIARGLRTPSSITKETKRERHHVLNALRRLQGREEIVQAGTHGGEPTYFLAHEVGPGSTDEPEQQAEMDLGVDPALKGEEATRFTTDSAVGARSILDYLEKEGWGLQSVTIEAKKRG